MDVDLEEAKRILAAIEAMRNAPPPPPMSLARYVASIDGVPLPTPEQRVSFAEFVSAAHSWYKHLPRFLPGAPFQFFLDRHAGCDVVIAVDGGATVVPRTSRASIIRRSRPQTTGGSMAISPTPRAKGRTVVPFAPGAAIVLSDSRPAFDDEQAQPRGLPVEIERAGRTWLMAVVHPRSAAYDFWHWDVEELEIAWPEECGLQETLRRSSSVLAGCAIPRTTRSGAGRVI